MTQICITSSGCALPTVSNVDEFWQFLLKGKNSFSKINSERWHISAPLFEKFYQKNIPPFCQLTSLMASEFKNSEIEEHYVKNFNPKESFKRNQTILSHIFSQLNLQQLFNANKNKRISLVAGHAAPSDFTISTYTEKSQEKLRKNTSIAPHINQEMCTVLQRVQKRVDTNSREYALKNDISNLFEFTLLRDYQKRIETILVDAACASSLAAFQVAYNKLISFDSDIIIVGGIDLSIDLQLSLIFAKIGILSPKPMTPFEKKTTGCILGEGGAFFVFKRLEDALKSGDQILGIVNNIGGSSDGRGVSLFEPSLDGQLQAYKNTYTQLNFKDVKYIEAHGTGTVIGDAVELNGLEKFFTDTPLYIGSVKANFGHTLAGAGAIGLLKNLMILKHQIIPPSPYIEEQLASKTITLNKEPVLLNNVKNLKLGLNSFGFGGSNYHLVVEAYRPNREKSTLPLAYVTKNQVVVNFIETFSIEQLEKDYENIKEFMVLPPDSLKKIDSAQIYALLACMKTYFKKSIPIEYIDKTKISTLSTCHAGLKKSFEILKDSYIKVALEEKDIAVTNEEHAAVYTVYNEKFDIHAEYGPGLLTNVIAGRIMNHFDFRGFNFNLSISESKFDAGINFAFLYLQRNEGMINIVDIEYNDEHGENPLTINNIKIALVSSLEFAKSNLLPINEIIKEIKYEA